METSHRPSLPAALAAAAEFLNPDGPLRDRFVNMVSQIYGVELFIKRILNDLQIGWDAVPESANDFLKRVAPVFRPAYLENMAAKMARIDHIAGLPVCDMVISETTFDFLLSELLEAILRHIGFPLLEGEEDQLSFQGRTQLTSGGPLSPNVGGGMAGGLSQCDGTGGTESDGTGGTESDSASGTESDSAGGTGSGSAGGTQSGTAGETQRDNNGLLLPAEGGTGGTRPSQQQDPAAGSLSSPLPRPPTPSNGPTPEPRTTASIRQITLRGQTLKEAWLRDDTIQEELEGLVRLQRDWSPATPGYLPVFHGTAAHIHKQRFADMLGHYPVRLSPFGSLNQITTIRGGGECVYTGFSALRCFLWAVFSADILHDPPTESSSINNLQATWMSCGAAFRGVVLLKYYVPQPAPTELNWYLIPAGMENRWYRTVNLWNSRLVPHLPPSSSWADEMFRDLHRTGTQSWPAVLHRKELPLTVRALEPFATHPRMFWRTAWVGDRAADYLQRQHEATFAITFEQTPKLPTAVPGKVEQTKGGGDKDKDKDGDKQHDRESRFRTWGKKTLRKLMGERKTQERV